MSEIRQIRNTLLVMVALVTVSIIVLIFRFDVTLMQKNNSIVGVDPHNTLQTKHSYKKKNKESKVKLDYEPFNKTNPHEDSWCPYAECDNSPTCTPCNRRFLFIIATGRSGSTTLLKMFNQLPNVRLSGENYNVLYHAANIYRAIKNSNQFFNEETIKNGRYMHKSVEEGAFQHNAMPIGSFSCVMQSLVDFVNPPSTAPEDLPLDHKAEAKNILGMKVIRLQQSDWSALHAKKFLVQSFPCARFIINIRSNTYEQGESVISAFKDSDLDAAVNKIEVQTSFLEELAGRLGGKRAKLIDMEDWKDDVSVLNDVVNWLGFEGCEFNYVLHENHDRYGHDERKIDLGKNCRIGN